MSDAADKKENGSEADEGNEPDNEEEAGTPSEVEPEPEIDEEVEPEPEIEPEGEEEEETEGQPEAPAADEDEPAAGDDDGDEREWTGELLPRVQQLLTRIFDKEEQERFELFFRAAAETIEALGQLELPTGEDGEAFPEATAIIDVLPDAVPRTFEQIDSFLKLVSREFPVQEDSGDDMDIDLMFDAPGEDGDGAAAKEEPAPGSQAIAQTLSAFAANLGHELRTIERMLKSPTADSDRWSTIEQLGEFRGRTRAGIGEMFFLAAREFAVVRQEDVVPFYKEDLNISLALRLAITTLRARINVHRARFERLIQDGDIEALRGCIRGFHEVFGNFIATEAFLSLRVLDRRSCNSLRRDMEELIEMEEPRKRQFETAVEGLTGFIDSLTLVNQRELLIVHDREAIANTLSHLDVVHEAVVSNNVETARESFARAVNTAWPLFGREPTFDGLLKLLRFVENSQLDLDDALALAGLIRRQL